jgi:hypothetical protein
MERQALSPPIDSASIGHLADNCLEVIDASHPDGAVNERLQPRFQGARTL